MSWVLFIISIKCQINPWLLQSYLHFIFYLQIFIFANALYWYLHIFLILLVNLWKFLKKIYFNKQLFLKIKPIHLYLFVKWKAYFCTQWCKYIFKLDICKQTGKFWYLLKKTEGSVWHHQYYEQKLLSKITIYFYSGKCCGLRKA